MSLRVDNHVHTQRSGHSAPEADIRSMRRAAEAGNLTIGLREHAPLPEGYCLRQTAGPSREFPPVSVAVGLALDDGSLAAFLEEVRQADVSLGFEVDILGGRLAETERLVAELRRRADAAGVTVDALNCSHHAMHDSPWDFTPQTLLAAAQACGGPAAFIRRYFAEIREAVATGLFQGVSHIEAPLKFGAGSPRGPVGEVWREEMARTLETLARHDVALEYNTGGLATWGRPYLSREPLALAVRLDLKLVVGSDAHHPDLLGRGFAEAEQVLRQAGVTEVWTYKAGRAVPIPLE
jgi:histidinol-phosphatase (PHP family)